MYPFKLFDLCLVSDGVLVLLSGARCRLFAYGPADANASHKRHSWLPSLNPRLVLPFLYRLTQVVLEKRLLIMFFSISQVIGCEDLYCVEWGVKLYSNSNC